MWRRHVVLGLAAFAAAAMSPPVQAQPILKVGTNPAGAPWSFHDPASKTEQGIAVELIVEIGKDAGFGIELVPLSIGELIPALNANKTDIIAANLLMTPERAALVDFSDPIARGGDGLVVLQSDTRPYRTLDDLKGLAVGSQAGSPFAAAMQKSGRFANLQIYPSGMQAMRAVEAGEIQAAVVGVNGAAYDIKMGRFPRLQIVRSYQPLVASFDAFSVRKGDGDLLRRINASLAKLKANGTLTRILDKYGQEAM